MRESCGRGEPARLDFSARDAQCDVLRDGRIQQENLLRHIGDRHARLAVAVIEGDAVDLEAACCRHQQPGDQIDQSRLAGTVRTHQADRGAGGDAQRCIARRAAAPVAKRNIVSRMSRRGRCRQESSAAAAYGTRLRAAANRGLSPQTRLARCEF